MKKLIWINETFNKKRYAYIQEWLARIRSGRVSLTFLFQEFSRHSL